MLALQVRAGRWVVKVQLVLKAIKGFKAQLE